MFIRNFYRFKSSPLDVLKSTDLIKKNFSRNLTIELCKKFNEQQTQSNIPTTFVEMKRGKEESERYASYFFKLLNRSFKSGNQDQIINSESFKSICESAFNILDKNPLDLRFIDKLSMLRSLQIIGLKPDNKLLVKLLEDLRLNINQLSLEKELKVLLNQVQFQDSQLQKAFVDDLVKSIETKLDKIDDLTIVLMIYDEKIIGLFSKEFLRQIDLKALELSKNLVEKENEGTELKANEISFFLHKLSLTKRRPKRLIQFLTNSFFDKDINELGLNNAISLIDSLSKLSYLSIELMKEFEVFLIQSNFLYEINNFDLNQLFKNFIKLRYEPTDLFDYLCDHVAFVDKNFGKKTLISMVNLMAFFNYSKERVTELLNGDIFREIDLDLINGSAFQIEYNWSLAFYDHLNKLPLDLFQSNRFTAILDKKYFFYLKPHFLLLYHYCKLNLGLDLNLPEKYFELSPNVKNDRIFKIDPFLLVLKKDHYLTNVQTELGYNFGRLFDKKHFKFLIINILFML